MEGTMRLFKQFKLLLALIFLLAACSTASPATNSPLDAIENIRKLAGFPESDLIYMETTKMINSPSGDLQVDVYQDEEGRIYSVDPNSKMLVEIDARNLLGNPESGQPGNLISQTELERQAEEFVRSAIPEFSALQSELNYEMGGKGDYFFFTWRMANTEQYFMPPFIQLALTTNGDLFAFYNTVTLP